MEPQLGSAAVSCGHGESQLTADSLMDQTAPLEALLTMPLIKAHLNGVVRNAAWLLMMRSWQPALLGSSRKNHSSPSPRKVMSVEPMRFPMPLGKNMPSPCFMNL